MAPHLAAAPVRVACPACGGEVHPIAGRCRHCRIDLTRARAAGPLTPIGTDRAASSRRPRLAFVAALIIAVGVAVALRLVSAPAAAAAPPAPPPSDAGASLTTF